MAIDRNAFQSFAREIDKKLRREEEQKQRAQGLQTPARPRDADRHR